MTALQMLEELADAIYDLTTGEREAAQHKAVRVQNELVKIKERTAKARKDKETQS